MAYSSQAQGFFSGAYGRGILHPPTRAGQKVNAYYYNEDNLARLDRVRDLAARKRVATTHVALAYLFAQPFAVYPIIGCSTVEHLRDWAEMVGIEFVRIGEGTCPDRLRDELRWSEAYWTGR